MRAPELPNGKKGTAAEAAWAWRELALSEHSTLDAERRRIENLTAACDTLRSTLRSYVTEIDALRQKCFDAKWERDSERKALVGCIVRMDQENAGVMRTGVTDHDDHSEDAGAGAGNRLMSVTGIAGGGGHLVASGGGGSAKTYGGGAGGRGREDGDPMNLTDYLRDKLRADGYTGVCGEDCGCSLEDFPACCEPVWECRPGYVWQPAPCSLVGGLEDPPCGSDGCSGHQVSDSCVLPTKPPLPPAVSKTGAV